MAAGRAGQGGCPTSPGATTRGRLARIPRHRHPCADQTFDQQADPSSVSVVSALGAGAYSHWRMGSSTIGVYFDNFCQVDQAIVEVYGRKRDRLAPFLDALAVAAGLHQTGMQIEIMRHHGRAQNAER